jgi:hypothetical protein
MMDDEHFDEDFDLDAELDQVRAAIREASTMLAMMHSELKTLGLHPDEASSLAVRWWIASSEQGQQLREEEE